VYKFNDANGNGLWDADEGHSWMGDPSLLDAADGTVHFIEALTDASGMVVFDGLAAPWQYKVWEEWRDCWTPTTPAGLLYWENPRGYAIPVYLESGQSAVVTFGNKNTCEPPPPPPPAEGCSPGYFRNHFDAWVGYSPSDDFDTTFGVDYFDPNITLGQAIWLGGGGVQSGGPSRDCRPAQRCPSRY
jgi:hypothetical protein